jgi:hypothetical protein
VFFLFTVDPGDRALCGRTPLAYLRDGTPAEFRQIAEAYCDAEEGEEE